MPTRQSSRVRGTLTAILLLLLLSLAPTTQAQSLEAPPESQSPVGVWELVELTNWTAEGDTSQPYGAEPSGMFIYTEDGYLSIQIMKTPPHPRLTERPNEQTLAVLARSYIAYYGRYEVDYERGLLMHKPVGSLNPNYIDTDRPRPYRIEGDELIIEIISEEGAGFLRRLRRVESLSKTKE